MRDPAAVTEVPAERATLPPARSPRAPGHVREEVVLTDEIGRYLQLSLMQAEAPAGERLLEGEELLEALDQDEPTDQGDPPQLQPSQLQAPDPAQPPLARALPSVREDPPEGMPVLERIDWRLAQLVQLSRGEVQLAGAELELEFRRAEDEHKLTEVRIHGRQTCIEAIRKYVIDNPKVAAAVAGGAVSGSGVAALAISVIALILNAWASGQLELPGLP